ncbi:sensor histidine kinase [Allosaccharopolyspora coralli]|uniref:sensor histidine kinase n=1 Tax=Allosaccharopolyspora coralli TaxID=2665642 RepID=UPI0016525321|nr:nitrate- and nitrite sensing domain-containing protein [Allosaccharopolyspora coralli]
MTLGSGGFSARPGEGDGGSRWQLRHWRLRTKLLTVLLVPSIAAVTFGAIQVVNDYQQADVLEHNQIQVELDTQASFLADQLQRERDLTVDYIASGRSTPRTELDRQRQAVDRSVNGFRAKVDDVETDHADHDAGFDETANKFVQAAANLDRLPSLREVADGSAYPPDAALRAYTDSVESLLNLGEQGITTFNNPDLVRIYLATNALSRVKEQESIKRARLTQALHEDGFEAAELRDYLAADAQRDASLTEFRKWATPEQVQAYDDTVTGLQVDQANNIEERAIVRSQNGESMGELTPASWLQAQGEKIERSSTVGQQLRGALRTEVDDYAAAANTRMWVEASLIVATLALAGFIALLVARSLLLPLRTLRRSALNVAQYRLPEAVQAILNDGASDASGRKIDPVPVHTREEIGQVARSFDQVHEQALNLAAEQALLRTNVNELFVNLARRSQTLVQRQLGLIDTLEQDEQDPDQLSQLFELDHLATRMRRNNENLLILGGTDLTRRMMKPVPLSEVLGAAVSEVEQYARVAIAETPELAVQGRAVNDIVHLIAELLENATVFSNPDTEVGIRTAYRRAELVLEIRDRGVGIDAGELDEINYRLGRPPEVDVAVSRRMGLYVVSVLARRHNIAVSLENNADLEGGVTATVRIMGEYVSQLTPDGPVPMQDARGGGDERDPLTETGSHTGLAAAFGHAGAGDPAPTRGSDAVNGFAPQPAWQDAGFPTADDWDTDYSDEGRWSETDEQLRHEYSVQVSESGGFGATDVPRWDSGAEDEPHAGEPEPDEEPTSTSLSPLIAGFGGANGFGADHSDDTDDRADDVHEGQCGTPPGIEDPGGLFHSPFEEAKTSQFEPVTPPDEGLPNGSAVDTGAAETEQPSPFAPLGSPEPAEADDAPTQRLPIYEAVLSQWFRESDGADAEPGFGELSETDGPFEAAETASEAPTSSGDDSRSSTGPGDTVLTGRPLPTARGEDPGWGSADAGWEAADALAEQTRKAEESTTTAGLPKRVPKSNLLPGSAAQKPQPSTPRKPAAPRSPDAVRGRMSNFQQGIRRGRHAKAEPVSTEQPRSNPSRHEEQE